MNGTLFFVVYFLLGFVQAILFCRLIQQRDMFLVVVSTFFAPVISFVLLVIFAQKATMFLLTVGTNDKR